MISLRSSCGNIGQDKNMPPRILIPIYLTGAPFVMPNVSWPLPGSQYYLCAEMKLSAHLDLNVPYPSNLVKLPEA